MSQYTYEAFTVDLPENWEDVSEELGDEDLVTFAQLDGKGALQVSLAVYRAGGLPKIGHLDLEELRDDFARRQGLGSPIDTSTAETDLLVAEASYHSDSDLVRVWYVTDGANVALLTYVCAWEFRREEAAASEAIVRSFKFRST